MTRQCSKVVWSGSQFQRGIRIQHKQQFVIELESPADKVSRDPLQRFRWWFRHGARTTE